ISTGTSYGDAVYQHITSPTRFYMSTIRWVGDGLVGAHGWELTLKDGTVYFFGDTAPLQSIRDRYGNNVTLTRASGPMDKITKITSTNGRWIQFSYDANNRIAQATDTGGRIVRYTYDASGRLSQVTDPAGGVTQYTYDASHEMLTIR